VALDDFGAGFAFPAPLHVIDFDIAKIDGTFVQDLKEKDSGEASFRNLAGLASRFAPVVVVDGSEAAEHSKAARAAGATHPQGFHRAVSKHFPIGFVPMHPRIDA